MDSSEYCKIPINFLNIRQRRIVYTSIVYTIYARYIISANTYIYIYTYIETSESIMTDFWRSAEVATWKCWPGAGRCIWNGSAERCGGARPRGCCTSPAYGESICAADGSSRKKRLVEQRLISRKLSFCTSYISIVTIIHDVYSIFEWYDFKIYYFLNLLNLEKLGLFWRTLSHQKTCHVDRFCTKWILKDCGLELPCWYGPVPHGRKCWCSSGGPRWSDTTRNIYLWRGLGTAKMMST